MGGPGTTNEAASSTSFTTNNEPTKYRTVEVVEVYPTGRLILYVQDHDNKLVVPFKVSSGCLKAASPVWRRMLDKENPLSPFYKRNTNGGDGNNGEKLLEKSENEQEKSTPKVFRLADDNTSILLLLLWQIHHRSDKVPTSLSVERLFALAVVCDKYDCATVMYGTVRNWIANISRSDISEEMETRWIFIAETFGFELYVSDITIRLRDEIELQENLVECWEYKRRGNIVDVKFLPQRYLDTILKSREQLIESVISKLKEAGNFLSNPRLTQNDANAFDKSNKIHLPSSNVYRPEHFTHFENCLALAHGLFIRQLKTIGLYDLVVGTKYAKDWSLSISGLLERACSIKLTHNFGICNVSTSAKRWLCPVKTLHDIKLVTVPDTNYLGAALEVPYVSRLPIKINTVITDIPEPWKDSSEGK